MRRLRSPVTVGPVRLVALFIATLAGSLEGQEPGTIYVHGGAMMVPAVLAPTATLDVRVWRGVSVLAVARQVEADIGCANPVENDGCQLDGFSTGVGVRLRAESSDNWWPYVDILGGGHRYARTEEWNAFVGLAFGVGWYVEERWSIAASVDTAWLDAAPLNEDLVFTNPASFGNTVVGLVFQVGYRLR